MTYAVQIVTQTPGLIKTISINQTTGVISYSLNANAFGSANLRVTAKDPANASGSLAFNLTVQPVNDAPVAQPYSHSTLSGQTLTVAASGVLASVGDADNDTLTVAVVFGPVNGTLTLQPNGVFVYTPNANFHGVDTFRFVASDGILTSNTSRTRFNAIRAVRL